jgi:hypothetical protein
MIRLTHTALNEGAALINFIIKSLNRFIFPLCNMMKRLFFLIFLVQQSYAFLIRQTAVRLYLKAAVCYRHEST